MTGVVAIKATKPVSAEPPTLLTLFMTDLLPNPGLQLKGWSDLPLAPNTPEKVRVFYNLYEDLTSRVHFVSFYVPEILFNNGPASDITAKVVNYISLSYKHWIEEMRSKRFADYQAVGDANVQDTRQSRFSGQVFIYHAGTLTLQQRAELEKAFLARGAAQVQFRGMDYAVGRWSAIQAGAPPPPKYELRNNLPELVGEPK